MRIAIPLPASLFALLLASTYLFASTSAIANYDNDEFAQLEKRGPVGGGKNYDTSPSSQNSFSDSIGRDWYSSPSSHSLEKRRGGGGRGGSSGGSGRSGGGRTSGGSTSGRTSRYHSSFPRSSPRLTSSHSSSNAGGRTSSGSGTPRSFGGAYSGGAAVPYTAGKRSSSGITPYILAGAALGLLPGLWLASAFAYPFSRPHLFHNTTASTNETLPVLCLCQEYSVCGCDENHNETYAQALYQNASALPNDADMFTSKIADVNNTRTVVINGTLANGTTADGGTDDDSAAMMMRRNWGLLVVAMIVGSLSWI